MTQKRYSNVYYPNLQTIDFSLDNISRIIFLLLFGITFGAINWVASDISGITASAGTVVLSALPIIIGSQLIISFLSFDTRNVPKIPLQTNQN